MKYLAIAACLVVLAGCSKKEPPRVVVLPTPTPVVIAAPPADTGQVSRVPLPPTTVVVQPRVQQQPSLQAPQLIPAAAATPTPSGRLETRDLGRWHGNGPMQTEKFTFTTGDGFVTIVSDSDDGSPGVMSAWLVDERGEHVQLLANSTSGVRGHTNVYKTGTFYIDVNATQRWGMVVSEFYRVPG